MTPVLAGMLVALTMAFSVGPGLLLYFQAAIRRGFVGGLAVIAGLWTSDLGIIGISYFGVSELSRVVYNRHIAAIVCALALLVFGVAQWAKKPAVASRSSAEPSARKANALAGFVSGFLVNSSNPFVYVFWMTVVGVAGVNFGMRTRAFHFFFVGLFSCAWTCDTVKCLIFSRIAVHLDAGVLTWINRAVGSALVIAAVVVVCKAFFF